VTQLWGSSFNQVALITLYASLAVHGLWMIARNLASAFSITSTCEQALSRMAQNKPKFHSSINDVHLHDVMRTGFSKKMDPSLNSLAEQ
jgi:hypothetical protein